MALNFNLFGRGAFGSTTTISTTTTTTSSFGLLGTSSLTSVGGFGGNTSSGGLLGSGSGSGGLLSSGSNGSSGFGSTLGGSNGSITDGSIQPVDPVQVGPQGVNISEQIRESATDPLKFEDEDFAVTSGDPLTSLKVVSLPANGTLMNGTLTVALGEIVDASDFDDLTYTPDDDFDGEDNFTIAMSTDGKVFDSTPSTVEITVLNDVNSEPTIDAPSDIEVDEGQTASGVGAAIVASYSDQDSTDALETVTLTAVPAEAEGTLTYTADNGSSVEASAGDELSAAEAATLSFKAADDAVEDDGEAVTATITYTVTGSDDETATGGTLDIIIEDGNDAPSFDTTPSLPIEVAENSTDAFGGSYSAEDPEGDSITYSLAGEDKDKFTINTTTGLISPAAPGLDYEEIDADGSEDITAPEYLRITRIATDSADNTVEQELTVTVTDVANEAAPVFTSSASHSVAEGEAFSFTLKTTDADEGDTVSYTAVSADTGLTVTTAGEVELAAQDYEDPQDADKDNTYEIKVKASDKDGNTATQTLSVTVTDESDQVPVANVVAGMSANEEQTIDIGARIVGAYSDPDGDELAKVSITPPAAEEGELTYLKSDLLEETITGTSEVTLTAAEALTLKFTAADEFDADDLITLSFKFEDSTELKTTTSGSLPILLKAINDAPTIDPATLTFTAKEDDTALSGTSATFTDAEDDTLTYSLTGTHADLMSVNETTGEVSLKTGQDYEALVDAGSNVLTATLKASDGAASATAAVSITIEDENEAPEFEDFSHEGVTEGESDDSFGSNIWDAISDPEGDKDAVTLTFSVLPVTGKGVILYEIKGAEGAWAEAAASTPYTANEIQSFEYYAPGATGLPVSTSDPGVSIDASETVKLTFELSDNHAEDAQSSGDIDFNVVLVNDPDVP